MGHVLQRHHEDICMPFACSLWCTPSRRRRGQLNFNFSVNDDNTARLRCGIVFTEGTGAAGSAEKYCEQ